MPVLGALIGWLIPRKMSAVRKGIAELIEKSSPWWLSLLIVKKAYR